MGERVFIGAHVDHTKKDNRRTDKTRVTCCMCSYRHEYVNDYQAGTPDMGCIHCSSAPIDRYRLVDVKKRSLNKTTYVWYHRCSYYLWWHLTYIYILYLVWYCWWCSYLVLVWTSTLHLSTEYWLCSLFLCVPVRYAVKAHVPLL